VFVAHGSDDPIGVALDLVEGMVYWSEASTGSIKRVSLDGSQPEDVLVSETGVPVAIAVDPCNRTRGVGIVNVQPFALCLTGPGKVTSGQCNCSDLSGDARIDLVDFAVLQRAFHE
jgi:hypothetical protein